MHPAPTRCRLKKHPFSGTIHAENLVRLADQRKVQRIDYVPQEFIHMMRMQSLEALASNLMLLTESFDSISDFCLKLGINRQQFNKYLAARHMPSQKILTKIAKYFHMEPADLFKPASEFSSFYDGVDNDLPDLRENPDFAKLLKTSVGGVHSLHRYHGVYYRYHCSSIFKGQVLRSVTAIFERDGLAQYVTVERFPLSNGASRTTAFSFVYRGYCVLLGDRLFMVDFESKQKNELTFTVLTPQHRTPARFMFGVLTGVASTSYRQPFSTRLAFVREGTSSLTRSHLRMSTVLSATDEGIPPEIRAYLRFGEGSILYGGEG